MPQAKKVASPNCDKKINFLVLVITLSNSLNAFLCACIANSALSSVLSCVSFMINTMTY